MALSVRVRPSGLKRDCGRRATSTGRRCLVNVHAKSRLIPETSADTPVRNKGQAAACPDRTRAIPCTLQRRQQVNPRLETQRFLRDLSHHNRDTLTGTGRQRFIPSLGRYLSAPPWHILDCLRDVLPHCCGCCGSVSRCFRVRGEGRAAG